MIATTISIVPLASHFPLPGREVRTGKSGNVLKYMNKLTSRRSHFPVLREVSKLLE